MCAYVSLQVPHVCSRCLRRLETIRSLGVEITGSCELSDVGLGTEVQGLSANTESGLNCQATFTVLPSVRQDHIALDTFRLTVSLEMIFLNFSSSMSGALGITSVYQFIHSRRWNLRLPR